MSQCMSLWEDVAVLVHMSEDLILHVFSYLTPASILKTRQLSKAWAVVSTMDCIWQPFCQQRWRLPPRLMKLTRHGVHSYLGLYCHLQGVAQTPLGTYTTHDKLTWGHSRHHGVETWLTLGHRSDCKLVRVGPTPYIHLRVIVQNLASSVVLLDPCQIRVHFKNGPIVVVASDAMMLPAMRPRVVAWNGAATAETLSCSLAFLDFAVVSVYVPCDDACEFEADFLERAASVWIPMKRRRGDAHGNKDSCADLSRCRCMLIPDHHHHFGQHVPVVDESVVWSRYTQLGRGFMVLTCKDKLKSADHLPPRYLIDHRL
ncbi:Aste57867_108 [Aphanomyces stellatus]|uniref:Aste57867_108 protein n=1 Tax=Aphanomyces stellatus TaxID=120398 RepID=A0A485K1S3_9STRA|nr:hypothetical protein As57867_000108 [Aphanomyces stellatus]VFT77334.1 Aste57867_108 [Aphanomyces stellatus]